ncbi:MAG: hypothetical protein KUG82_11350 [Pseudomonadales bacterium]|nr:hypothetical protein [Pseudomonadales bacterium]
MLFMRSIIVILVSMIFLLPAHAIKIEGVSESDFDPSDDDSDDPGQYEDYDDNLGDRISFTEIYQDGHFIRLDNNKVSFHISRGHCLIASDQHDTFIEGSCDELSKKMKTSYAKKIAEIMKKMKASMTPEAIEMMKNLRGDNVNAKLKKLSTGEVSGIDSAIFSAGSNKYWISESILNQIKKEMDYTKFLEIQQNFEDAYLSIERHFRDVGESHRIEKELSRMGYLMKQTETDTLNSITKNMLTPEQIKLFEGMDQDETVVLEVLSVSYNKVDLSKIKPSGNKVSIDQYVQMIFEE